MNKQKYYAECTKCDKCNEVRGCVWVPTGAFEGQWQCSACRRNEELADVIKIMSSKLVNTQREDQWM